MSMWDARNTIQPSRAERTNGRPMKRSPFHRWTRCAVLLAALIVFHGSASPAENWRGLAVAPEHRCSPYDRRDYPYPQSVEPRIVAAYGGRIYGPYTGHTFASRHQTDIEHVVAVSEALDSGLCAASASTRRRFASDLLNLTLAAPEVNRCGRSGKCAKDAAEWLPPRNRCWFANRVVEVRRKYRLTIDRREAEALEQILSGCESTEMVFHADGGAAESTSPPAPQGGLAVRCRRRARPLGRQSQRTHLLQGSEAPPNRAGTARPSGLSLHAR